jgi:ABC-type nitrate/sulfonate/bicarbonate transport system ATPase subunit
LEGIWERERWTVALITPDVREALLLSDRIYVLGPRPGQVVLEVPVPLPRPRRLEMLRGGAATELEATLLTALGVGA